MGINIKNNFGPIIEAKDNAKVVIGSDDALKRYEAVQKVMGGDIQDVEFEELPADKQEEIKKACAQVSSVPASENPIPEEPKGETKGKGGRKKKEKIKSIPQTFRYVYFDEPKGYLRLKALFDFLKSDVCGWLDKNAGYKEWEEIFKGETKDVMLIWHGSQSQLKFLFAYMIEDGIITYNKAFGPYEILCSHFKKPDNTLFKGMNGYHEAAMGDVDVLRRMSSFLNIHLDVTLAGIVFRHNKQKKNKSADSHINPYVHQKQQKNYKEEGDEEFEAEMERQSWTD